MKMTENERGLIVQALKHSSVLYRTLARERTPLQDQFLQQSIDAAALAEKLEEQ